MLQYIFKDRAPFSKTYVVFEREVWSGRINFQINFQYTALCKFMLLAAHSSLQNWRPLLASPRWCSLCDKPKETDGTQKTKIIIKGGQGMKTNSQQIKFSLVYSMPYFSVNLHGSHVFTKSLGGSQKLRTQEEAQTKQEGERDAFPSSSLLTAPVFFFLELSGSFCSLLILAWKPPSQTLFWSCSLSSSRAEIVWWAKRVSARESIDFQKSPS